MELGLAQKRHFAQALCACHCQISGRNFLLLPTAQQREHTPRLLPLGNARDSYLSPIFKQCQNDLDLNLGSVAAFFHSLIWLHGQNVLTLLENPEFSPWSHEIAVDCNSLSYSERSAFSGAASSTSRETRSLW